MESDKNIMPNIDLFPHLRRIGGAVVGFFCLHELSPVSEHFQGADEMLLAEPTYSEPDFPEAA